MNKIFLFLLLLLPISSFASWEINPTNENQNTQSSIDYNLDIDQEISKEFSEAVSINEPYKFDLSTLEKNLKILYPEKQFEFLWTLKSATSQSGVIFERTFKEKWEKEIDLTIHELITHTDEKWVQTIEKKILLNKIFQVLVFEKSFLLIYSDEIVESDIDNYIEFSKKDGIFVSKVGPLNKTDIELTSILNSIDTYEKDGWLKSDFITLWWSRDFIFNIVSKISGEIQVNEQYKFKKINILSISSYNLNILQSYLKNFLANKPWLNKIVLINEDSKYIVLKNNLIQDLNTSLNENKYNHIDVNLTESKVSNFFFVSKFINNLSNLWYTTNSIYLFLIIPLILTIIIFFKHFVWLSPIGIVVPLFVTLLFFKIGFVVGLLLIFFYIGFNLFLSIIINRFNLLYAPKMAFLINLNIVFFILFLNIGYALNLIVLNLSDIIFFIIFIVISEKMINIIISKDLIEYKEAFLYTLLISLFCFGILNINAIKIIMLAYPEIILGLIPLNFMIGRFSWLRITEYFRFKEIIKSIEE